VRIKHVGETMERRESKHQCPKCQVQLVERWYTVPDGSLVNKLELQRVGLPFCPAGHRITEWNGAGQPVFAV
jgi:hypothetical protein